MLLDQLHVNARAELEEENNAEGVPVEPAASAVELVEKSEGQQESVVTNGECSIPAPESAELPGPSAAPSERVQPPDITSTITQSQSEGAVAVADGKQEQRPADILDQVSLTDRPTDSDSSGPSKPPRQFAVEPDIVASTKKPPPSRPPPPSGGPPPRPPPPSWQSLPSKKSQECLRPSGLEGRENSFINPKCVLKC